MERLTAGTGGSSRIALLAVDCTQGGIDPPEGCTQEMFMAIPGEGNATDESEVRGGGLSHDKLFLFYAFDFINLSTSARVINLRLPRPSMYKIFLVPCEISGLSCFSRATFFSAFSNLVLPIFHPPFYQL